MYLKIGGAYDFNNTPYIFILGTTDVTVESLYSSSYRDWVGGRITNSEITMSTASYSLPYEQYGLGTWKSILTVNDLSKMARSLITYGIISMDFLLGEECNLEVGHYNIGFTSFSW